MRRFGKAVTLYVTTLCVTVAFCVTNWCNFAHIAHS